MKKTYADACLERAERATAGPWKVGVTYHHTQNAEFIAHARQDVPELARRLKLACEIIHDEFCGTECHPYHIELEEMPEEK